MCALEAEEAFATATDGRRIFYRVSGRGPFALVMPVPWGMDSYVYTKGLSSLEFYLALVTFDPRGVGRSGPAATDAEFSLGTIATDAACVADAVGLPRSVVLGHSGGGAVAITYALRFPQQVSHLILVSTAARWTGPSPLEVGDGLPATEEEMRRRMREAMQRAVRDPDRFAHAMDELLPRMRFSPERLRWTGEVGVASFDVRSRLHEIRVPTLLVQGREDPYVSMADAEAIHEGIHGSRLALLEDCGHWPHVELRREFVEAVKEFLGLADRPQLLF